mmetsp:Transcript_22208/g.71580  ORF Transcript_22208/g.71580 Transcript_22208/m.71580 type:complete len:845 (-) Transcript_22208:729-3263(-)
MLRCLCKFREPEIIEPLMPSIKACLEHRHAYVRKNAAMVLYHVHKYFGQNLTPDGAEVMQQFLTGETEVGSRRNAFLMLLNEAEVNAIEYLRAHAHGLDRFGDGFALLVLELTRKVCRRDPSNKSQFVPILFQLLNASSAAVSYEAAWTLASLSSSPTAVRAAATTYTSILCTQSDNNVKLIVLERLSEVKSRHPRVLAELLMDMLRVLSSPNIDICRRTLEVAMGLVSSRNIEEIAQVLRREIMRTRQLDMEQSLEYRRLLVTSMHVCAMRFPEVASSIVDAVIEFLGHDGATDVILVIRSVLQRYVPLREGILRKLLVSFDNIQAPPVLATALWVVGEYLEGADVVSGFDQIISCLGSQAFIDQEACSPTSKAEGSLAPLRKTLVLSDGTYATQPAQTDPGRWDSEPGTLRHHVCKGDIFLGTVAAGTLTKLACKVLRVHGATASISKKCQSLTLAACCNLHKLASSVALQSADISSGSGLQDTIESTAKPGDSAADLMERLVFFVHVLLDPSLGAFHAHFLQDNKVSFEQCLSLSRSNTPFQIDVSAVEADTSTRHFQPDELILWRQLRQSEHNNANWELCDVGDLAHATGLNEVTDPYGVRLKHMYQLTGFSDPVYAETCVIVHDYDIIMEILVINRTSATLTNLTLELATLGDLRLVERPQVVTLGPVDQLALRANIKVSSTETGHIFGTIVYENSSSAEKSYINLNSIHLDIMDYIRPAYCADAEFRHMWAEFEWENKVAVATSIPSLSHFLSHIVESTNMRCLTPRSSSDETSNFLAANLYAKSIFGEDALVNVSIEKKDDADGKLSGYIRIRSKTQGIALSLGDRVTAVQRAQRNA